MCPLVIRGSIHGRLVTLRPLRRSDAPSLDRVLRDMRATRWLPPRVRRETGEQFVERVLQEQRTGRGLAFAIVPQGSQEAVGQIRLFDWYPPEQRAEIGYWIRRAYWGRGFATEALRLTCQAGFRRLHLHRIDANVVAENVASAKVLEKVGFREEGVARSSARVGQGWADVRIFGLLRPEFRVASEGAQPALHPHDRQTRRGLATVVNPSRSRRRQRNDGITSEDRNPRRSPAASSSVGARLRPPRSQRRPRHQSRRPGCTDSARSCLRRTKGRGSCEGVPQF